MGTALKQQTRQRFPRGSCRYCSCSYFPAASYSRGHPRSLTSGLVLSDLTSLVGGFTSGILCLVLRDPYSTDQNNVLELGLHSYAGVPRVLQARSRHDMDTVRVRHGRDIRTWQATGAVDRKRQPGPRRKAYREHAQRLYSMGSPVTRSIVRCLDGGTMELRSKIIPLLPRVKYRQIIDPGVQPWAPPRQPCRLDMTCF